MNRSDWIIRLAEKHRPIKFFCYAFALYFIINLAIALLCGYAKDLFIDKGNLINYTLLVPSQIAFLFAAYAQLRGALHYPVQEGIMRDVENVKKYQHFNSYIISPPRLYLLVLLAICTALQFGNIAFILNDTNPKSIWLEGGPSDIAIIFNGVYYVFLNAVLLMFLLDAFLRWLVFTFQLWRLYYFKSYGGLFIDERFLSPSSSNPSYSIGKYLIRLGLTAMLVMMNYFTFFYFYMGGTFSVLTSLPAGFMSIVKIFYWIFIIPFALFIIPVIPILKEHKKLQILIEERTYNGLVTSLSVSPLPNNVTTRLSMFVNHVQSIESLRKSSVWPIEIQKIQTIYGAYLVPIILELINRIIYGK